MNLCIINRDFYPLSLRLEGYCCHLYLLSVLLFVCPSAPIFKGLIGEMYVNAVLGGHFCLSGLLTQSKSETAQNVLIWDFEWF